MSADLTAIRRRVANSINGQWKADVSALLDLVDEHERTIAWLAQTVHQAHHGCKADTWKTCPMNTCNAAQQAVGVKQ